MNRQYAPRALPKQMSFSTALKFKLLEKVTLHIFHHTISHYNPGRPRDDGGGAARDRGHGGGHRHLLQVADVQQGNKQSLKRRLNGGSRFHNHREDPYQGLPLVEAPTRAFTFKALLRHSAKRGLLRDYEPSDGPFSSSQSQLTLHPAMVSE